jgi:hypothetical protein
MVKDGGAVEGGVGRRQQLDMVVYIIDDTSPSFRIDDHVQNQERREMEEIIHGGNMWLPRREKSGVWAIPGGRARQRGDRSVARFEAFSNTKYS